jgi:hypothetical protein
MFLKGDRKRYFFEKIKRGHKDPIFSWWELPVSG